MDPLAVYAAGLATILAAIKIYESFIQKPKIEIEIEDSKKEVREHTNMAQGGTDYRIEVHIKNKKGSKSTTIRKIRLEIPSIKKSLKPIHYVSPIPMVSDSFQAIPLSQVDTITEDLWFGTEKVIKRKEKCILKIYDTYGLSSKEVSI